MNFINKIKHGYLVKKIAYAKVPDSGRSSLVRKKLVFAGKVQGVGFRFEMVQLAQKLNLVGWVRNNRDTTVEAEAQGEETLISFLIDHMSSLKRAKVTSVKVEELPLGKGEDIFKVVR